ncbi:MAG TPA: hypothetical protein PKH39_15435 [Woeseiaceae bacterium]|nr:hypothetical protein [Woeseiaceae bacterium]
MKNGPGYPQGLFVFLFGLPLFFVSACGGGGAETNPDGTIRAATFSKSFGTDLDDGAYNFIETQDGGYAVMGVVGGYLDLSQRDAARYDVPAVLDHDFVGQMWFAKLDIDGNLQWEHRIDSEVNKVPTSFLGVDQARSGEFCLVGSGREAGDTAGPQPVDTVVMRLDLQGNVLWELAVDSGGWPGFELAASDGGLLESQDWLNSVVAGEDGSCTASGPSRANLVTDRDGNVTTTRNALSSIVLSANGGQLQWLRREEASPTGTDINGPGTGRVFGNGNGEVIYIDEHGRASDRKSILKVLRRDGSSRFSRVLDVAFADIRHAYLTDDPDDSGQRDGQKNDGVLLSHGDSVTRLDRDGETVWQREFGSVPDLDGSGSVRRPQFAVQSCVGANACSDWVVTSADIRLVVNAFRLQANGDTDASFATTALSQNSLRLFSLQVEEVEDGRINIVAIRAKSIDEVTISTTQATLSDTFSMLEPVQSPYTFSEAGFVAPAATISGGALDFNSRELWRYDPSSLESIDVYEIADPSFRPQSAGIAAIETSRNEFVVIGQSYNALVNEFGVQPVVMDQARREICCPWGGVPYYRSALGNVVLPHFWYETQGYPPQRVMTDGTMSPVANLKNLDGERVADIAETDSGWLALESGNLYQSLRLLRFEPDGTRSLAMILGRHFDASGGNILDGARSRITRLPNGDFVVAAPLLTLQDQKQDPERGFSVELFVFDRNINFLWSRGYRLPGAMGTNIRIAGHPNGGIKILATVSGARQSAVDDSGFPVTGGLGGDNVMLMHLDGAGDVINAQLYGAGKSEVAESLAIASDGGYLIAGRSYSLGVRSEAWVLRLGPDGEVAAGCNTQIGTIPGYVFEVTDYAADTLPAPDTTLESPGPDAPKTLSLGSISLGATSNGEMAEARQCFGTVSDDPLMTPVNAPRTLTVNQAGSERGLILSTPEGIRCGMGEDTFCDIVRPTGSIVTLRVDDSDSVRFRGWGAQCTDRLSNPHRCVVTLDFDTTMDVFFEADDGTTVNLATQVTGNGRILSNRNGDIDCAAQGVPNLCSATYPLGTPVGLEISVAPPERFLGWADDCAQFGSSQSLFLTMTADTLCSATFSGGPLPTRHTLQVALDVDGQPATSTNPGGSVNSAPGGIVCTLPGTDCSEDYDEGTVVSLNAQALGGFAFLGWTSSDPTAGCHLETNFVAQVTMDQARDCTARFRNLSSQTYNMTITVLENNRVPIAGGPFGGRVTSSPPGFDCGPANSDCFETFVDGTQVTLTPTPEPGYQFAGWGAGSGSGDCAPGSPAVTTVTVDGNLGCIAMFDTIAGAGNNNVTVAFDAPATGARVVDVNTGLLDCTAACTVGLPVSQSPIRLRPINQGARWTRWFNCDAVIADPGNPTGPMLCEIGIAAGPRAVTVEFGL